MRWVLLAAALMSLPARAETIAIVGARAWTNVADQPIENATIVIVDGRIASIGAAGRAPDGARIIDARGKVVTPSLDAAATQIGLVEVAGASDTDDRSVASGPLGAAFDAARAIDPNGLPVQAARADGVARAMAFPGPAGSGVFAGQGVRLHLVNGASIVERPRAAMFVTAGGAAADAAGGSRGAVWTGIRNALEEARAYRVRVNPGAPRDQLLNHVDAEALLPVLSGKMPLAIFAHREADIRQALAIGRDFAVRVVIVGGAEAWRASGEIAAARVPVILDPLDELPANYDVIGARRDNAAMLVRAGVQIGFWVSAQSIYLNYNVGPALREGAGIAVANGLPYAEALRIITMAPSAIWSDPIAAGVIATGRAADLVIWDGDPLEPASAPVGVFIAGREVPRETRQTLLRDRYRPVREGDPASSSRQ